MTTIVVAEFISAVFLGILLLRFVTENEPSKSNRRLICCLLLMMGALLVDMMAYTFVGPVYPVAFRYVINMLSFMAGSIVMLGFIYYCEELVKERTKVTPWVFLIAKLLTIVWLAVTAIEFMAGRFVVYTNGTEDVNYSVPIYLQLISIVLLFYLPIVNVIYGRKIGGGAILLLCLFNLMPIIGIMVTHIYEYDYSYVFSTITLVLIAEFIHGKQTRIHKDMVNKSNQIIATLSEDFNCVDYIEFHDNKFEDEAIQLRTSDKLRKLLPEWSNQINFAKRLDLLEEKFVYEPDRKRFHEETKRERVLKLLEHSSTVFVNFRAFDESEIKFYQMKISAVRSDDRLTGFVIGLHSIDDETKREMEIQRRLQDALDKAEEEAIRRQIVYKISDSSQWSYEVSADDEVFSAQYPDSLKKKLNADYNGKSMGWIDHLHPDDRERVRKSFMAAIYDHTGNTHYSESFRILGQDGKYHWARSTGQVIRRSDGTGEFIGMATDFTEQFEEQKRLQDQLAEALSMAETANKAKTDFLFNMSHDIRTPMNAIIGFTNIAKKEIRNPEKALDCLAKVQVSSEILLNLINDVLDMSRIESGKVELHEGKYEITEAFDTFEATMANLAASKDIDLKFNIGKIRDRYIYADGPRFDRVLINIISNAIKYTLPYGFVKVSVDQLEDSKPGYGNYRFTVADSGIGMSEEFQKHMFEDFTREENSTTSGIQGTGLGLSLAKKLVEMMGGTISCISKQGIGTTFTIVFPFRLQTEKDRAEKKVAPQEQANIDLNGRKALLVEDNELNRELGEEILSANGIVMETAENGQKAVNMLRERGANYYDFILMDIQMPVMNGYEATQAIRRLMPELKAPIIAISANAFAEDRKKSIDSGMDDHVAKPINVKELVNVLAKFLKPEALHE